jgi:YrbI family 3-deoxy-D-manno-octulosonate 8-phosphate phosphatase
MIKLVIFDFDGVFTDGKFYFNNNNTGVSKCYNAKDSYALKILNKNDIKCGIITNDKIVSIKNAPHIFNRLDKVSIGSDKSKISILNTWLQEYGFSYQEVAYIGDDLSDIEILKKIGFSCCPNNAVEEVKDVSQYICKNKGGDGAVREFVDLIIKKKISKLEINENKVNKRGKITAVIPVRKGSTRCRNKNFRDFGDTNLLKLKIETLKKVKDIDKILVSSNCDIMLGIAKDMGVDIHKRDEKYCTSECSGSDLYIALANAIESDLLLMTFCVTPFISVETYINTINKYRNNKCDSISTVYNFKHYLWYNNKPINHDYSNAPPTQNLPDYFVPSFGIHLTDKYSVFENKNVISKCPIFEIVDEVECIDIDTPYEYLISELLHNNNINSSETCNFILNNRKPYKKLELLDCTIRDGGYINNWNFTDKEIVECYKSVSEAGYDYFEIGFRTNENAIKGMGKWGYSSDENIDNIVKKYKGCKIAVMAKMGTFYESDFKPKKETNIDLIRFLICKTSVKNKTSIYTEENIIESKKMCKYLLSLEYKVCLNVACSDIITEKEIEIIIKHFNDLPLKYIYLADTYGGLNDKNIPKLFHNFYRIQKKYNCSIPLGIHLHNNTNLSLTYAKLCIFHGCNIIDSCINGMGRGSGNLKTEELILELNTNYSKKLNLIPILEFMNSFFAINKDYKNKKYIFGYHFYYFYASYNSLHPNFINEIIMNYSNLSVKSIIKLINNLSFYTKSINNQNYDKDLIKNILNTK